MGKEEIVFIDTETTGLEEARGTELVYQPHVIEICVIRTNHKLKQIDELDTLIKPPVEIPSHITKITNITNDMVKNAPNIKTVFPELKKIFKGADVMVAQNLRFDKFIIENEAARLKKKFKFPKQLFCTVEQSLHFAGMRLNSKELLATATGSIVQEFKNIHRAKADVEKMIIYYEFIRSGYVPSYLRERR